MELANKFNVKVILQHVIEYPTIYMSYGYGAEFNTIVTQVQDEGRKRIDAMKNKIEQEGLTVQAETSRGSPFYEIVATARKHEVDLIVMATHGHGAVQHMLMGNTAEKVVRKAPCPVLTIRHPEHEFVHP
jgi:nucleotide-binding universal stress UspA family protein